MRHLITFVITFTMTAQVMAQTTWTVCPEKCDFASIQDAINASSDGDTISISPGICAIDATINPLGKSIEIQTGRP